MNITQYTALLTHTRFLFPKSRQYPFDKVCEKIVRTLEKRSWKIPGIQVEFTDWGTGEEKYRYVSTIKGEDFKLRFSRVQGRINPWKYDIAAVNQLVIPKKDLHIEDNESGPTFYTYVGDNWKKDKEPFMSGLKFNSKLEGKPRTYLHYTGRCGPLNKNGYSNRRYLQLIRNPYLVNDDDLGREYKAHEGEPKYFHTCQMFQEFDQWLNKNVLQKIESVKKTENIELTTEPVTPYPKHLRSIYVVVDWRTYDRVGKGEKDKSQLEPSQKYALTGGGCCLVPGSIWNDGSIPEEAYDGYKYGNFKKPDTKEYNGSVHILRITPKRANNIFVADDAPAMKYKRQCFEGNLTKQFMTNEEYDEYHRCLGRTIVPIHQYKGNYEKPFVMIGRSIEFSFDEVEIVDEKENT